MAIPFSLNPPIGPIPAAGAWIYNNITETGNTHSNTTLDTLSVGTSFLMVGQQVSGAGIPAGTTIASITSATAIVLSQAATATASGITVTFGSAPNYSSGFNASGSFALPLFSLTDVPGCDFAIPETQTIVAGASFVPAPGAGIFAITNGATTGSTIQINVNTTWTTIFTATVSVTTFYGYLVCDGGNVRFTAAGATNPSFTFYRFRQQPVL